MAESTPAPQLWPLAIKDRSSIAFLEYGQVDVRDGAFVLLDKDGARIQIPVGGLACLMLEPGVTITHAAVSLAARVGCLIVWVGEAGVRLYAAGQPGGARADRLLYQAKLSLDDNARLRVVREMYRMRFGEDAPSRRSVDQLRGIEGARVREAYRLTAESFGVKWRGRAYNPTHWDTSDIPNKCLSAATACLYGVTEAAVLAAGYAPAIGFLHRGKPLSFVYDIADVFKFETVVPAAFRIAGRIAKGEKSDVSPERAVRLECRDMFRRTRLLERIVPTIGQILNAGGMKESEEAPEGMPPAIKEDTSGDDGHRG